MKSKIKIIVSELVRWHYWYPFRIFVHQIPIPLAYKTAGLIVPVFYFFAKGKRKAIAQGLATMYEGKLSQKEISKLTFDTFDNLLKSAIDVLLYPKFNKKYCEKNFKYVGLENLDNALKAKRGVVLLHGHFGNPHMIMPAIGFKGYRLNQLASRTPPEKLKGVMNNLIYKIQKNCYEIKLRFKESLPVRFLYIDDFLRAPFEALKRNEVIAIGIDGREGVKLVEINFLNNRAIFFTGSMRLILKANPTVLPTFHLRNKDNTHTILIDKPMELEVTGEKDKDINNNIRRYVSILEEKVYKYPWLYANAFSLKDVFFLSHQKRNANQNNFLSRLQ